MMFVSFVTIVDTGSGTAVPVTRSPTSRLRGVLPHSIRHSVLARLAVLHYRLNYRRTPY
jgi:hypothetical protein